MAISIDDAEVICESEPINLSMQLEVRAGNKILVPGCEPTSALSSTKLASWMARAGCGHALVDLDVALAAIPGSYVKYGNNFNRGNTRQKWYVLPPVNNSCPCMSHKDWYKILRGLASDETPEEESFDACNMIDSGYCPSPDFREILPPPPDPYQQEGTFPGDVGVLPPVPPWGTSGT